MGSARAHQQVFELGVGFCLSYNLFMAGKTNALRHLDSLGIAHGVREYPVDENHLDALTAALKVGFDPDRVFKTLVAQGDSGEHYVFCIPASFELNLKKAAKASKAKKVDLIPVAELLPLTGYIRGGCSPLGMKKSFPTFIDETAQLHETILISAGQRGLQIEIDPRVLAELCKALFMDLV